MRKWLKRIGLGLLGLLVFTLAAGAAFEQWARTQVPRDFPPPGKMVDIGGRRIQIDCRGSGSPTVLLEAGGDWRGSITWDKLHDELARTNRVCSYSRAGIMWSDPADDLRDGEAVVADLHNTLEKTGEHPPFVLVGWSLGGPYTVLYTQHYGADVAGLVLIDPSHPDQNRLIEAITHRPFRPYTPLMRIASKLTWTGLLRLIPPQASTVEQQALIAFLPISLPAAMKEIGSLDKTLAEESAAHDLGSRPLIVMTAMAPYSPLALQELDMTPAEGMRLQQVWKRMHDEMATWSHAGRNEIVPDASHEIPDEKPQAVIQAIDEVVAAVRSGAALKP